MPKSWQDEGRDVKAPQKKNSRLSDKLVPVIIAKPSKSICQPNSEVEKPYSKSNVSESGSTRTDKNGKESFDSYSTKNINQGINFSNKKLQYIPPFMVSEKRRVRKSSNEISMVSKSKSSYYCWGAPFAKKSPAG